MLPQEFDDFTIILDQLAEMHRHQISVGLKKLYFAALSPFSLEQIQEAAIFLAQDSKWFPKPADFVEAIDGNPQSKAENAWSLFVEAVRRGGYMKSLYCANAALVFAICRVFGGWFAACTSLPPVDDPMFAAHKKTFVLMYAEGQRQRAAVHYLPGRAEIENASNGGLKLEGRATYPGNVVLIQDAVRIVEADFSTQTGKLASAELLALPGMTPEAAPLELIAGTVSMAGLVKGML